MRRIYYYEDDPLKTIEGLARYAFARKFVDNRYVLDVGCGARKGPFSLAQSAREVVGTDISQEAVSYSEERWPAKNLKYEVSDATSLSFADSVFDVVVALEVIEHVHEQARFLHEAARVLKNNGLCILSTPNKSVMSQDGIPQNPDHVREFCASELKELLSRLFSSVELYGQSPSNRVQEVLAQRQLSYQKVSRIPVFIRRLLPRIIRRYIFGAYVLFSSRMHKISTQEDINESDFPILNDAIGQAHYLIAVCRK